MAAQVEQGSPPQYSRVCANGEWEPLCDSLARMKRMRPMAPSSMICFALTSAGAKFQSSAYMSLRPRFSNASTISRACSTVVARGFSQTTGFPASQQAMATS